MKPNIMNSLAHIEINVSDLKKSSEFYSKVLGFLGWQEISADEPNLFVGFKAPDKTHVFLVQAEKKFSSNGYHRKNVGINHVAFRVDTPEAVDQFHTLLQGSGISTLYTHGPADYSSEYKMEHYYAVYFEDPDRMKLEVVYCK
jgi:catechol 2,3-dioxygenase-like lactoylglutathione lyase family enzyme